MDCNDENWLCTSQHYQGLALQLVGLEKIGCDKIYQEKRTGSSKDRPQLKIPLAQLRFGDVIVIWKLDRLARSLRDLVDLVNEVQQAGASLWSLNDQIDTTSSHGKFIFHVFATLAEFERDIIRDRTNAGLQAARARGRVGGRPKGLSRKAQHTAMIAERLYREQKLTTREICEQLSISKGTLHNYLRHQGITFDKGQVTP